MENSAIQNRKKIFLATRQPHPGCLGRDTQTDVRTKEYPDLPRSRTRSWSGGSERRGRSPHDSVASKCWESGLPGSDAQGMERRAPTGLCTKGLATITATGFWSGSYNMTHVGIRDFEKANSARNSLCSGSLPLELLAHSSATQTSVSSGRTANSSICIPHS